MISDVVRAYVEALAIRNVCIVMPEGDLTEAHGRNGTRRAVLYWQVEVAREMVKIGFSQGQVQAMSVRPPTKKPENIPSRRRFCHRRNMGWSEMAQGCIRKEVRYQNPAHWARCSRQRLEDGRRDLDRP